MEDITRQYMICDSVLHALNKDGSDHTKLYLRKVSKNDVLSKLELDDERSYYSYFMAAINSLEERNCIKVYETANRISGIIENIHITEVGRKASKFPSFEDYLKQCQKIEEEKQQAEINAAKYNIYTFYVGLVGCALAVLTFAISYFNKEINWFVYISAFLMGAICTNVLKKK